MESPGAGFEATTASGPSLALAAADDPRSATLALRAQPVVKMNDTMVLVTRRRDVEWALRQPQLFSSGMGAVQLGNVRPLIPLQIDPPRHAHYRRMLDPLFHPRRMAALDAAISDLADTLIDRFVAAGACDLHQALTVPLPCQVFLDLFGLPQEDLGALLAMKDGIIRPAGAGIDVQVAARQRAALDIYEYFRQAIAERRSRPSARCRPGTMAGAGGDLLHHIMHVEVDGAGLSDEEMLDICFLFVVAGLDTVTDALDCIFAHLAQHAEHRHRLQSDESKIAPAVEELLRWESPVPAVLRVVTEDVVVGGCPIAAGQSAVLLIGSANTDSDGGAAGQVLDLNRDPNPHLAFGAGVHRCLGAHLARVEMRAVVRQLHRRVGDYRLAPDVTLQYTAGLRSVPQLPLELDPLR